MSSLRSSDHGKFMLWRRIEDTLNATKGKPHITNGALTILHEVFGKTIPDEENRRDLLMEYIRRLEATGILVSYTRCSAITRYEMDCAVQSKEIPTAG
jgi:hypothetical protein